MLSLWNSSSKVKIPCILYCTLHICFSLTFTQKEQPSPNLESLRFYVHMIWCQRLINRNDKRNELKFSILRFKKIAIPGFHSQAADRRKKQTNQTANQNVSNEFWCSFPSFLLPMIKLETLIHYDYLRFKMNHWNINLILLLHLVIIFG